MVLSMTSTRNLLTWFLVTLLVLQGVEALSMMNGIDIALNGEDAVSINQELFDGVPTLTVAKGNKLGGRKMVVDIGMKKDQLMKDAVLNQETTKISGANHFVGKSYHQEGNGEMNVNRNMRDRIRTLLPVKVNGDSFIAFSADYHIPKQHPPKHN
ncbi:hypothetical protein ACHQM5_008822 [Ranunculus cassubicifolius]